MKKVITLVYVLIALVLVCTNVYAMVTANLSLVADSTTVKAGEDVIVTVQLSNLSAPVSSLEGYININKDVLESISSSMIVANESNKIEVKSNGEVTDNLSYVFNPSITDADYNVIFNTNENATKGNDVFFVMDLNKYISANSDILKLKFKVKSGTADADIANAVSVNCVVAYSTTTSDKSEELSANLNIKVDSTKQEPTPTPANNTPVNNTTPANTNTNTPKNTNVNNTNTNTNKNTNTNTPKNTETPKNTNTNKANPAAGTNTNVNTNTDKTVSGNKLPATGAKTLIIPAVVLILLAYISYAKYLGYKDV